MPKLKKYEIEAVTRQIISKIETDFPQPSEEKIHQEFMQDYHADLCEYISVCDNISKAEERKKELKEKMNLNHHYSHSNPNREEFHTEHLKERIKRKYVPQVNNREIEDLVVVNANLDLAEIIKTVCNKYGV